jgi:integrase
VVWRYSRSSTCYLSKRVCDAIRGLPRIVGNPWVFTGTSKKDGQKGRRDNLRTAWEMVKRDAALESLSDDLAGFRIHDLRHHRISVMLAEGIAPQIIVRQCGHTTLEQLRTYGHVLVDDVARVLSRLEPVAPAAESEVVEMAK